MILQRRIHPLITTVLVLAAIVGLIRVGVAPSTPARQAPDADLQVMLADAALPVTPGVAVVTPLPSELAAAERRQEEDQARARSQQMALLEQRAMRGEYQAQRNLAWMLSQKVEPGSNAIEACAWRLVIVVSGAREVDQSDIANKDLACGRLREDERIAAVQKSQRINAEMLARSLGR